MKLFYLIAAMTSIAFSTSLAGAFPQSNLFTLALAPPRH